MTLSQLAPPSRNPTVDGHLKTVLRFVFNKLIQSSVDDMLPGQVVAYNRTTNMATIQPMISMVTTLNEIIPRGQVAEVPVLQLGGGGFVLNFPIKPGDLGWIKANDRDISLFTQIWQMVRPNTKRMHSFEDAIFIPSILTGFTIESPDSSNVVLQSLNASVRFSMGNGNVCITDKSGYSQSVNCVLDVQSTTRAFAFPRMTKTQRNAIPSPFPGMAIFNITEDSLQVYTAASGWGT